MSDGEGAGNALGDFGFSSESDVDVCRGCGQEKGHKADCAYSGGDAAPSQQGNDSGSD